MELKTLIGKLYLAQQITGNMEQYVIYYENGIATFRDGVRDGNFIIDRIIDGSTLGFSGIQNTDWECIYTFDHTLL